MTCPVIQRAWGEARNSATSATSSAVPEAAERDALQRSLVQRRVVALALVPDAARELDRAGSDGIDADALARQRGRLAAGIAVHRRLHGRVGGGPRRRPKGGDRGNVDDAGTARGTRLLQPGQRRTRAAHHRQDVDREAGGPALLVVAHAEARGVVDQHVDAAQRLGRGRHPGGDGSGIGEVAGHGVDPTTLTSDVGARLFAASPRRGRRRRRRHPQRRTASRWRGRCRGCRRRRAHACLEIE